MRSARIFSVALALFATVPAFAQDYPYDDADSGSAASLPVEVPNAGTPTGRVPKKATSLFRMGLKIGGNFTSFQDRLCTTGSASGCVQYLNRSFTGMGFEGRIGFGWDLAYQPVFIETEIGYLHKMANIDTPLRVLQIQQGLFHRERIGKDALWKNGVLGALDLRVFENSDSDLKAAAVPAFGVSSLIEWGSFLAQVNFYLHQFRANENHWSTSFLTGLRF